MASNYYSNNFYGKGENLSVEAQTLLANRGRERNRLVGWYSNTPTRGRNELLAFDKETDQMLSDMGYAEHGAFDKSALGEAEASKKRQAETQGKIRNWALDKTLEGDTFTGDQWAKDLRNTAAEKRASDPNSQQADANGQAQEQGTETAAQGTGAEQPGDNANAAAGQPADAGAAANTATATANEGEGIAAPEEQAAAETAQPASTATAAQPSNATAAAQPQQTQQTQQTQQPTQAQQTQAASGQEESEWIWDTENRTWRRLSGAQLEEYRRQQKAANRKGYLRALGDSFGSYFGAAARAGKWGVDPSGVSASDRRQAELQERQAAEMQKAAQRNMQVANRNYMDEAEKIAAAQAQQRNRQEVMNKGAASAGAAALARESEVADYNSQQQRSDEQFQQGVERLKDESGARQAAEDSRAAAKERDYLWGDMAETNARVRELSNPPMDEPPTGKPKPPPPPPPDDNPPKPDEEEEEKSPKPDKEEEKFEVPEGVAIQHAYNVFTNPNVVTGKYAAKDVGIQLWKAGLQENGYDPALADEMAKYTLTPEERKDVPDDQLWPKFLEKLPDNLREVALALGGDGKQSDVYWNNLRGGNAENAGTDERGAHDSQAGGREAKAEGELAARMQELEAGDTETGDEGESAGEEGARENTGGGSDDSPPVGDTPWGSALIDERKDLKGKDSSLRGKSVWASQSELDQLKAVGIPGPTARLFSGSPTTTPGGYESEPNLYLNRHGQEQQNGRWVKKSANMDDGRIVYWLELEGHGG